MKSADTIVADECVDYEIVETLRANGFEVLAVVESYAGFKDQDVLKIAVERQAILLTEDKDFGELIYRLKMPHYGVLLLRFPNDYDPLSKAQQVSDVLLERHEALKTAFSVLEPHQLRLRRH